MEDVRARMNAFVTVASGALGGENLQTKAMFGGMCAWVGGPAGVGSMIGGVMKQDRVCLRTDEALLKELTAYGCEPMMTENHPWRSVSDAVFFGDEKRAAAWVRAAAAAAQEAKKQKEKIKHAVKTRELKKKSPPVKVPMPPVPMAKPKKTKTTKDIDANTAKRVLVAPKIEKKTIIKPSSESRRRNRTDKR